MYRPDLQQNLDNSNDNSKYPLILTKFGMFWTRIIGCNYELFMLPKELWEAYSNRTVRPFVPLLVRCISPIFFEVGIPNLVCGYILGWRSVA